MPLPGIFSQEHLCWHFHFIQGSTQRPLFQGTLPPTPEPLTVGRLRKRKNFPHENMNYFCMICQEVSCNCGRTYVSYGESLKKSQCMEWLLEVWVQILGLHPSSHDLGWTRSEAAWNRVSVSSHRLKSSSGSESPESCQLDWWPVTRPWLCRNEFPWRDGKSKTSVY